jgi:hypothetical protein
MTTAMLSLQVGPAGAATGLTDRAHPLYAIPDPIIFDRSEIGDIYSINALAISDMGRQLEHHHHNGRQSTRMCATKLPAKGAESGSLPDCRRRVVLNVVSATADLTVGCRFCSPTGATGRWKVAC